MLKYEGLEYDKSEGLVWQEKVLYPQGSERIEALERLPINSGIEREETPYSLILRSME